MKAKFLVPLFLFFALAAVLGYGLTLEPGTVPSPLIDKPAPEFKLARLDAPGEILGVDDMRGEVWLLNFWASWCVSCRQEHPLLVELARSGVVPIIGINYKDEEDDATNWLRESANPYRATVIDADGRVGIDYGVYATPETFLIDRDGVIRYKHIGPITPDVVTRVLLPRIQELSRAG